MFNLKIKKVRRYIPNGELVRDLQRAAKAARKNSPGKNTLSTREYDRLGSFNSSTLITRFGSWNKAIIEADLMPVKNRRPSKRALLQNLTRVWSALGRQPKLAEMTLSVSRYSRGAYIKQFGSWLNTLEAFEKHVQDPLALRALPLSKGETDRGEGTNRAPSLRLRMAVMKRDRFRCVLCGGSPANDSAVTLQIDHIIPWSKGGKTVIGNLQTLCSECNNGKSDD